MPSKVKVWNGRPDQIGICRLDPDEVPGPIKKYPTYIKKKLLAKIDGETCIHASESIFKKYGCMSWQDLGVVQKYIETLLYSCKKWK
jgi:hypothetical protein